jgi:large subunit ribosomal protein L27
VGIGRDDTLFAKVDGLVRFEHMGKFSKKVNIQPVEEQVATGE